MKQRTESMQELPSYLYQVLPNDTASISIMKFIEEETRQNDDGEDYTVYIY